MTAMLFRAGYWRFHPYRRLSVSEFVEEWVGWDPLIRLVGLLPESWRLERAFIATLFETGGRVSEVLALQTSNFEVREAEGLVIVRNMPLFKRFKKIAEKQFADGKRGWVTQRLHKTRKPFPILLKEPLAELMVSYVEALPEDALLFPSPRRVGQPLTRHWAYKLVRALDYMAPPELKANLGLYKPGYADADSLHLWLHWFRAQRACQLVSEYGFELHDLIDWFSWEHMQTALTYARRGWKGLAAKMLEAGSHAYAR